MDKGILIDEYRLTQFRFLNIHSVGSSQLYYNPCIGYVKKGYAKFLYQGKTLYAHEGDLIYIARSTVYQSIWYGSPEVEWYSISFAFKSKGAFGECKFQILTNYPSEYLDKMFETYDDAPLISLSYFYMLLNDVYGKLQKSTGAEFDELINRAVEYIESNFQKQFSVKELAKLLYISEAGLYRRFKKATGVTPIEYKHNLMIQNAIELLTNSDLSIESISTTAGFPSSNYFRKVFKELTGKSPKDLRQKRQQH